MKPKQPNPYRQPFHQWPADVLAAYQTFPLHNGMTLPLNDRTWPQWKEWARKTEKKYWPGYLLEYIEERKRQLEKDAGRVDVHPKESHTYNSVKALDDAPPSA